MVSGIHLKQVWSMATVSKISLDARKDSKTCKEFCQNLQGSCKTLGVFVESKHLIV